MGKHGEIAEEYFKQGHNCAQSVAAAFAPEMGIDAETAMKMCAGYGGGVGRMREVCGAFLGLVFVMGTLYGSADPAAKTEIYTEVQKAAEEYKQRNGGNSIICRELLGLDRGKDSPVASARTQEYYRKRPCTELVGIAADIMEEYIEAHKTGV
ncbi:MAG: C-GCAxxG-C-C family protein [Lachnospiraceae bacterium]|jgi:C_GCAxxG_C_C family probable redox protein|nr:C-GCAxxG-C-C family protein [Lachnospiraceae bacterium]